MSIKKYVIVFLLMSMSGICQPKNSFIALIHPEGDAAHLGSTLGDCFERALTLQCAEYVQNHFESHMPEIQILITRSAGEIIPPLQNANFANRLEADIYLNLHFFQETGVKSSLYLYTFSNRLQMVGKPITLMFYPFDQAYLFSKEKSKLFAQKIKEVVTRKTHQKEFNNKGIFTLPYKPLLGIVVPAIAIEVGLINANDWIFCAQLLIESLTALYMHTSACEEL